MPDITDLLIVDDDVRCQPANIKSLLTLLDLVYQDSLNVHTADDLPQNYEPKMAEVKPKIMIINFLDPNEVPYGHLAVMAARRLCPGAIVIQYSGIYAENLRREYLFRGDPDAEPDIYLCKGAGPKPLMYILDELMAGRIPGPCESDGGRPLDYIFSDRFAARKAL